MTAFPSHPSFRRCQAPYVGFDDFSSFVDSLGTFEGQAYGLEAITKFIGDKFQLAIYRCRVQTMSRTPVLEPLDVLYLPRGRSAIQF